MKPPSKPEINKNNPNDWFIFWNHDVPAELWHLHRRKRERIKKRDDINEFSGAERERHAEFRRSVWEYMLQNLSYNPFAEELREYRRLKMHRSELVAEIEKIENAPVSAARTDTPTEKALASFINSRIARRIDPKSVTSYQGTVDWFLHALRENGNGELRVGELRHVHLSEAVDFTAEEREWSATTINKQVGFLMTIFNWLEDEEYVPKNPSKGKFVKLPAKKGRHTWYDRNLKELVKEELLKEKAINVYRAMQFTYWILIRSKTELRKLRIGDIDTTLKRIRYSTELSKNSKEQYRDYPPEFDAIIKEMGLERLPKTWFVFGGRTGEPGPDMVGHNFFSKQFKKIKEKLGLSANYTIYGMKHTRIVHELMKGTDGIEITTMARHSDYKTTVDYMRDYDLSLKNVYAPEDLTF